MRLYSISNHLRAIFIVTLWAVCFTTLYSQNRSPREQAKLDSLFGIWQDETQADSNRVNAFQKYIWDGFLFSNTDSAYALTEELEVFAQRNDNDLAWTNVLNLYGCYHYIKSDYLKALGYFERKLEYDDRIDDPVAKARTYGNIGLVYQNLGDFRQALKQIRLSYEMKEKGNDLIGMANSATNIGNIYLDKGMPSKAVTYFEESRRIEEQLGEKRGLAGTYVNIGNVYTRLDDNEKAEEYYLRALAICEEIGELDFRSNALTGLGGNAKEREDYEQALDYYRRALAAREQIGEKKGIAASMMSLGDLYKDMGDYPRSLQNYKESLRLRQEIGLRHGTAISHIRIGNYYRYNKEYQKAINECAKGEGIAAEIKAYKVQKDGCHCLYMAHKALGQTASALEYFEMKRQLEDSIDVDETARQIQQMDFRQEMFEDSLQRQEEALKVQMAHEQEMFKETRTRNLAIGSGLLLFILAGALFSRNRYISRSKSIIEKEKDRSEKLLLNILPYEIAEELKEKGEAGARDFDMVSILFTDFKDFTEKSEDLTATALVAEINSCFKAFDHIVEKYGIEKIKTIGDAYMAAGGLPVPSGDAAVRTVRAALEMQAFITEHKMERDSAGEFGFEMRVGIHSGPVVAGIVGVKKFQYDVWGDTVNTASRMETNGLANKVNISHTTYELIKDEPGFEFESRGEVSVKGKGNIRMYFVSLKS